MRMSTSKVATATEIAASTAHISASGASHSEVSAATAALAAGKGPGHFPTAQQTVLASATIATYIASAAGTVTAVAAFLGTAVTGDRTQQVDVFIGAVSVLTGGTPIMLDAAATTTVVQGSINAAARTFAKGDVLTVVTTYTAGTGGGGGNLSATVGYQLT